MIGGRRIAALVGLGLSLWMGSVPVSAATTTCGSPATFSVTLNVAATQCWTDNGNFGTDEAAELAKAKTLTSISSLVFIDKSNDATTGTLPNALTALDSSSLTSGTSGKFSITAPGYTSFLIVFKADNGPLKPDWAAFLLPGTADVSSISWLLGSTDPKKKANALSHLSLFGLPTPVPVPAPLALLLVGLGAVGFAARRAARRADPA